MPGQNYSDQLKTITKTISYVPV